MSGLKGLAGDEDCLPTGRDYSIRLELYLP